MRIEIVRVGIATCAIAALAATGCASNQTKERLGVALAENADLRQQNGDLEKQFADAAAASDRANAEVERKSRELAAAQQQAMQNAQYAGQVATLQAQLASAEGKQKEMYDKMNDLLRVRPSESTAYRADNPRLAAFRSDLKSRLERYGVTGVDVDVRTAQDGQQRVAVVLQNSFRAGSAS